MSKLKTFSRGTKAPFIRKCLGRNMSVTEIIEEAKKNGFAMDRASCYQAKSNLVKMGYGEKSSKVTKPSTKSIFRQNNNHVIEGIKMNFLGFDYDDMTRVLHLVVERMGTLKASTI